MVAVVVMMTLGAAGAVAWIGELGREPVPALSSRDSADPVDEPATTADTPSPPPVQPTPAAEATVVEAKSSPPAAPPRVLVAKATKSIRSHRTTPHLAALAPIRPQKSWEQQQEEYEHARAAYDASERLAGFQWAQQNRIRIVRYCRVAVQRTPSFVDGCMNYLSTKQTGGRSKSPEPVNDIRETGGES